MAGGPGAGQDTSGSMSPQMANLLGLALMMASKGPVGSTPPGAQIGMNLLGQSANQAEYAKERQSREQARQDTLDERKQRDILEAYKVYSGLPGYTTTPQEGAQPAIPEQPFGKSTLPPLYYEKPEDLSGAYTAASGGDPAILAQVQGIRDPKTKLSVIKMLTEQAATNEAKKKQQEMADLIAKRGQEGPLNRMSAEDEMLPTPPKMDSDTAKYLALKVASGQKLDDTETKMAFQQKKEGFAVPPNMQESQSSWKDENGITHTFKPPTPEKAPTMNEEWRLAFSNVGVKPPAPGQEISPEDSKKVTAEYNRIRREGNTNPDTQVSNNIKLNESLVTGLGRRYQAFVKDYAKWNVDPIDDRDYDALKATPAEYKAKYQADKPSADEMSERRADRYRTIKEKIAGTKDPTPEERAAIDKIMNHEGWQKVKAPDTSRFKPEVLSSYRDALEQQFPAAEHAGEVKQIKGIKGLKFRSDGTQWQAIVE